MGRRSFAVRDIVEIFEHWHQGRSIISADILSRKIAVSLGVDRKTVGKYSDAARQAGFTPGQGSGPAEGWAAWVDRVFPGIRERRRPHLTATEFQAHQEQITIPLQEVTPTVAWRRLRREQGLSA